MPLDFKRNNFWFWWLLIIVGLTTYKSNALAQLDVPVYESNPNAEHLLFLHFGSHSQEWITERCPDGSLYQGAEIPLQLGFNVRPHQIPLPMFKPMVYEIWQVVSEDFSPFNINVVTGKTTQEYNSYKSTNRSIIYLGEVDDLPDNTLGHASVGYDCDGESPYLNNRIINEAVVALNRHGMMSNAQIGQSVSHEAGHIYGLKHHTCTGLQQACPIMSYAIKNRYIWKQGRNRQQTYQDDVEILTRILGLRGDDHSNTSVDSTSFTQVEHSDPTKTPRVFSYGVLEQPLDRDVFTFRVSGVGKVRFNIRPGIQAEMTKDNPRYAVEANIPTIGFEVKNEYGIQTIMDSRNSGNWEIEAVLTGSKIPSTPYFRVGETYLLEIYGSGRYGEIGMYTIFADGPVADFSGPRVTHADNSCKQGSDEVVRIYFDEPVDQSSGINLKFGFKALDNAGRPITAKSISNTTPTDLTPKVFDVVYPIPGSSHIKQIQIGAHPIKGYGVDKMGQPYWMDQDNDGINGEFPDDSYRKSYLRAPLPCFSETATDSNNVTDTIKNLKLGN